MPAHFSPETMRFLRGLAKNNDRNWFEERRPVYERAVRAPLHALIEEINTELAEFAPEHVRAPHKIAMRIYRDTRFSPDKRPYKTHLAAWWGHERLLKTSAAGFFLQIGPAGGLVAAGVYAPERDELLTLRRWLAEEHGRYREVLEPLLRAKGKQPAMAPLEPNSLTRNPKGFPPDHPAADLLRARNWGVTAPVTVEDALKPGFAAQIVTSFRRAVPLVALLNEPFSQSKTSPFQRLDF